MASILPGDARQQITVQMLASGDPSAFSWPSGKVFVTSGLVDQMDDDELAASMAHELGHLLDDGHLIAPKTSPVASLRGCQKDFDAECRADMIGVKLLQSRGIPEQAMARTLEKVRTAGRLPQTCKVALDRRVELLRAQ